MKVLRVKVDEDLLLDLGDGREVRIAFKGSKREGNGLLRGSIGIHAPQTVKIHFAADIAGKSFNVKGKLHGGKTGEKHCTRRLIICTPVVYRIVSGWLADVIGIMQSGTPSYRADHFQEGMSKSGDPAAIDMHISLDMFMTVEGGGNNGVFIEDCN